MVSRLGEWNRKQRKTQKERRKVTFRRRVRRERPWGSMRTSSSLSRVWGPYESNRKTSWPLQSYTAKPSPAKNREVFSTVRWVSSLNTYPFCTTNSSFILLFYLDQQQTRIGILEVKAEPSGSVKRKIIIYKCVCMEGSLELRFPC